MTTAFENTEQIRAYYGQVLQTSKDLKTNACCTLDGLPPHLAGLLDDIAPEILERFYGCGAPIPPAIAGCTVLDLGCGTGRDAYLAARLVGPQGRVIGVDMTAEQLDIAERHLSAQMKRYGFEHPNIVFKHGYIEDLQTLGIADASVDVVISDCVINLSPCKERVFAEAWRVLKPGGELYFSDVFADRRLPAVLMEDPVLRGECLAGAMYWEDFRRMMAALGCPDVRQMSKRRIAFSNPDIEAKIGMAVFHSVTVRAFKLDVLEDRCEDYGQAAYYQGSIAGYPHRFTLDDHHEFETGRPVLVCGNTAAMVQDTRFARHFRVTGDRSTHFGLFPCGPGTATGEDAGACDTGCC